MSLFTKLLGKKSPLPSWLSLDIGSTQVRLIHFAFNEEQKVVLVGAAIAPLAPEVVVEGAILDYAALLQAVLEALTTLNLEDGCQDVIIGVGGEACLGLTTSVRLRRSKPESPLKEKELRQIQSRLEEAAFLEAAKQLLETTGNSDLDISLVESRLVGVKADDFMLSSPLGYKGEKLEVSLFTAFSPTPHFRFLEKLCADLKLNLVQVASSLAALPLGLAGPRPWEFNALLLDMSRDATEIALVFGGGVVGTKVLDLGGGAFTRQLARDFSFPEEVAEKKKRSFSRGELPVEEAERVAQSLQKPLDWWLSGLKLSLGEFSGVKSFPGKIYLVGGGAYLPLIRESLQAFPWTKDLPFSKVPEVEVLLPSAFSLVQDQKNILEGVVDTISAGLAHVGFTAFGGGENAQN